MDHWKSATQASLSHCSRNTPPHPINHLEARTQSSEQEFCCPFLCLHFNANTLHRTHVYLRLLFFSQYCPLLTLLIFSLHMISLEGTGGHTNWTEHSPSSRQSFTDERLAVSLFFHWVFVTYRHGLCKPNMGRALYFKKPCNREQRQKCDRTVTSDAVVYKTAFDQTTVTMR